MGYGEWVISRRLDAIGYWQEARNRDESVNGEEKYKVKR
jgi:hypothetical protein